MKTSKDKLLKIGEFSQLSQVTVKTLHHYDTLGLFSPAHIDQKTGYRYYSLQQLPIIHRIMALKGIGLSLDQIGLFLHEDLPVDQIRGMLRLKQAEIQEQVLAAKQQLAMVEFHLRMIAAETEFPVLDVVIKRLEKMRFLSFFEHGRDPIDQEQQSMARDVYLIQNAIDSGLIKFTGVSIDVFHGEEILPFSSPDIEGWQHEILLGVEESQEPVSIEGIGLLTIREEPAVTTAATLMIGDRDDPQWVEKVTLLRRWAIAHGYKPGGLVRYLHHNGPLQTLNLEEFVLEAQLPLKLAAD